VNQVQNKPFKIDADLRKIIEGAIDSDDDNGDNESEKKDGKHFSNEMIVR
jgi:hypothetical protein